jgi:hypothetical protein
MSPELSQTELLKALYEENGTVFRFYLTWRHQLLAGYFAVLAAVTLGIQWSLIHAPGTTAVAPFVGAALSALFWALDHRNRMLYRDASKTGVELESRLGFAETGYYGRYKEPKGLIRHTFMLALFYIGCGVLLFAIGIAIAAGLCIHVTSVS